MLLVCISIYLTSFIRYIFFIFDTYHPDTPIYVSKGVRIRGYFWSQKGSASKESSGIPTLHDIKGSFLAPIEVVLR